MFAMILALHALINIFSHLVALFNSISVWWHVIGVLIIIGILIFVPDNHQSVDFVFTERINNSGFADGAIGGGTYWFLVLPVGFLLTMYTITGYDASAHVAEETQDAEQAAAKGIWQSVASSALIGWFVLLAILFAATNVDAVNEGFGTVDRRLHLRRDEPELGRGDPRDRLRRPVLLRHGVRDQLLADVLRVLARPRHPGPPAVEPGQREGRARDGRARQLRARLPDRAAGAVRARHLSCRRSPSSRSPRSARSASTSPT